MKDIRPFTWSTLVIIFMKNIFVGEKIFFVERIKCNFVVWWKIYIKSTIHGWLFHLFDRILFSYLNEIYMSWKCKFVLQREVKAYAVMYLLEPLYQNFCLYSRKDTECVNGTICWCLMIRNRTNEVTLSWSSLIVIKVMLYILLSFNH